MTDYRAHREKWAQDWKPCKDCGGPVALINDTNRWGHIYPRDAGKCANDRPQDWILPAETI